MSKNISGKLLYFPKNQFSSRYGEQFYSVRIEEYDLKSESRANLNFLESLTQTCFRSHFIQYMLVIQQGHKSWQVQHRYSDFLQLSSTLQQAFQEHHYPIQIPELPAKTWFRVLYDQAFLINRKERLEAFLDRVCSSISQKGLLIPDPLAEFLLINPIAGTNSTPNNDTPNGGTPTSSGSFDVLNIEK